MTPAKKVAEAGPKKRLGQHFLTNPGIIGRIIRAAGFETSDVVLEIGPGRGALTIPLAPSVGHIVAVEKDAELVELLKEKLTRTKIDNVTIVNSDILTWDFNEASTLSPNKLHVIGNLPYNISSPFLERLIDNRSLVSRAVLMFQLEVARRITAKPGSKSYGALTVWLRYHAHPRAFFEVSGRAFYPRPKVDSMVLQLDFERPYPRRADHDADFKKIVKGAFAHRRKTLFNSFKAAFPAWDREKILTAVEKCGIDPGSRAEALDVDDFLCLTNLL